MSIYFRYSKICCSCSPYCCRTVVNQEQTLTQTVASTSTHTNQYVVVESPSSKISCLNNQEDSLSHSATPVNNDVSAVPIKKDVSAVPINNDDSANSFSFALQNVTDEIPQGRLPQAVSPVLELSEVAHDDVHSHRVEQTQHDSRTA